MTIGKRDIVWSYLSQILNYGAALFILPIILRKLPTEHLAIWYIFLAITSIVNLLDFGFQPNIMRNMSYIISGAQVLTKIGVQESADTNNINWKLFWSLVHTAKKIYTVIAAFVFLLLLILGTYYIYSITINFVDQKSVIFSWIMYLTISVINFYFCYYNPLLLGRGMIKQYNIMIIYSKLVNLIMCVITLELGWGLKGIALSLLISTLIDRYFASKFFLKNISADCYKDNYINLLPVLWGNSWRLGVVSIGAFFILRANIFLVTKFLPLSLAASYGLSLQLISTIHSVGAIFFTAHLPKINTDRLKNNNEEIKRVVGHSLIICWAIFILCCAVLVLFGNKLLVLMHSKTLLISSNNLLFMGLIFFLEMNHSLFATLITTKNIVPFVKPAIISGFLIVVCSFVSLKFFSFGLTGILFSQFIVQLSYNNWKWPFEGLKDLKISLFDLLKDSLQSTRVINK